MLVLSPLKKAKQSHTSTLYPISHCTTHTGLANLYFILGWAREPSANYFGLYFKIYLGFVIRPLLKLCKDERTFILAYAL